jgi:hypothetical protein
MIDAEIAMAMPAELMREGIVETADVHDLQLEALSLARRAAAVVGDATTEGRT